MIIKHSPTTTKPTSSSSLRLRRTLNHSLYDQLKQMNMMSKRCLFAIARLNLCSNTTVVGFLRTTAGFASSQPQGQGQGRGQDHRSFVVSYLVNSCGLSPETAHLVATKHKLKFQSPQNPDSVLSLLANHGFSKTHISKIVRVEPTLLIYNPDKTLLPKIQFFNSIGFSGSHLASIISSNPALLGSSLEKQLIPCYNFLTTVVSLQQKQVIATLKGSNRFLATSVPNTFSRNIALLRQLGMPQPLISVLFSRYPRLAALKHTRFVKAVEDTRKMGFDISKYTFVQAMSVLPAMTESKWESKFDLFGKWGWSKDDTLAAFRKDPLVINSSEKKIMGTMDFLINKMGWAWASKQVAERPVILGLSLKKNIVPKCYVIHVLQLKGLMKQDIRLCSILTKGERYFSDRYVIQYRESVPKLLDLYKGKVDLQECI